MMKKKNIIFGVVSIIIGFVLYLINWDAFQFLYRNTQIKVYPVAFFLLLGVVLIVRAFTKKKNC